MNNIKITTYEEVTQRIAQLNAKKGIQEIELKNNLKEVYENFQLKNILKKLLLSEKYFRKSKISCHPLEKLAKRNRNHILALSKIRDIAQTGIAVKATGLCGA